MRDLLLRALVLSGAVTILLTEALSPLQLLRRAPLAIAWTLIGLAALVFILRRQPTLPRVTFWPFETAIALGLADIAAIFGLTAVLSPPNSANSADAMAIMCRASYIGRNRAAWRFSRRRTGLPAPRPGLNLQAAPMKSSGGSQS